MYIHTVAQPMFNLCKISCVKGHASLAVRRRPVLFHMGMEGISTLAPTIAANVPVHCHLHHRYTVCLEGAPIGPVMWLYAEEFTANRQPMMENRMINLLPTPNSCRGSPPVKAHATVHKLYSTLTLVANSSARCPLKCTGPRRYRILDSQCSAGFWRSCSHHPNFDFHTSRARSNARTSPHAGRYRGRGQAHSGL